MRPHIWFTQHEAKILNVAKNANENQIPTSFQFRCTLLRRVDVELKLFGFVHGMQKKKQNRLQIKDTWRDRE
jgi:hypothetical protein